MSGPHNRRMLLRLLALIAALLLSGCASTPPPARPVSGPLCVPHARALPASADVRIQRAVAEARLQHRLFGGQTIERDGGLYRPGHHEGSWSREPGERLAAWQRVATFWQALSDADPPTLNTSVGRVARADVPAAAAGEPSRTDIATREALLRAAILDTPWSAAFISYLMKTAGFSRPEFIFSRRHADYVQAAFTATTEESEGRIAGHAWRACDPATTPPRIGDLLCATRGSSAGITRFDALRAVMAGRRLDQPLPMHCDIVVHADQVPGGSIEVIGGNVLHSVTMTRMALDANQVLDGQYIARGDVAQPCAPGEPSCRGHLGRKAWVVLLQFRD